MMLLSPRQTECGSWGWFRLRDVDATTGQRCDKFSLLLYMRAIGRIRLKLDSETCAAAVRAFILSRLNYANALLYGFHDKTLRKLQLVENNAARLVSDAHRHTYHTRAPSVTLAANMPEE